MLGLKSQVGILKIHPTHTTCTHAHPHTPAYTRGHPCTHGLNLINHLKLEKKKAEEIYRERDRNNQSYVIRSNTKKAEQRRKKKEGTRVR